MVLLKDKEDHHCFIGSKFIDICQKLAVQRGLLHDGMAESGQTQLGKGRGEGGWSITGGGLVVRGDRGPLSCDSVKIQ